MSSLQALSAVPVDEQELYKARGYMNSLIPALVPLDRENQLRDQLEIILNALVDTANSPNTTSRHRTATCNPISMFLERCQASKNKPIKQLSLSNAICLRLLNFFVDHFSHAKASPMRQLLVTVLGILSKNPDDERLAEEKGLFLRKSLSVLIDHHDHQKVKPSMQALTLILQRNLISLNKLLRDYFPSGTKSSRHVAPAIDFCIDEVEHFIELMMGWMPFADISQSAANLISVVVSKATHDTSNEPGESGLKALSIWAMPLIRSTRRNSSSLSQYRRFLFPVIFPLDIRAFNHFISMLANDEIGRRTEREAIKGEDRDFNGILLLSCLQSGKELGLIEDTDASSPEFVSLESGRVCLSGSLLGPMLSHSNSEIRIPAFSVIVSSSQATRPISTSGLKLLRLNIPHFVSDTDANTRSEANGLIQRLVDRIRAITMSLNKIVHRPQKHGDTIDAPSVLKQHENFLDWFCQHIRLGFRPSATYQRIISSLKSFSILLRSGLDRRIPVEDLSKQAQGETKWPFSRNLLTKAVIRAVQDLLLHPYDDVRQAAEQTLVLSGVNVHALQVEPSGSAGSSTEVENELVLEKRAVDRMLQTGRADHADGMARILKLCWSGQRRNSDHAAINSHRTWRLLKLISQLENNLDVAKKDMGLAIHKHPLHGILASLRYIIEHRDFIAVSSEHICHEDSMQQSVVKKIYDLYFKVWSCVESVLCNDAPEGHMPEDLEEVEDIGTKDILSYSWRAMKEASLLLKALVNFLHIIPDENALNITVTDLREVGKLCFIQLSEIRHRGAFSIVAQTFAAFCAYCRKSENKEVQDILAELFEETKMCIQNKAEVITRRSGGIPSIISGILCADPNDALFVRAVEYLKAEASSKLDAQSNIQEARLPQVHALNCLKDIFTNSKLNEVSEPFIASTFIVAANKLESTSWAIRNCGSMLFRALINRLLGSETYFDSVGKSASLLSYDHFPGLLDVLLKLLNAETSVSRADGRKGPHNPQILSESVFPALQIIQRSSPPTEITKRLRKELLGLMEATQWHVRDMAARSYSSLNNDLEITIACSELFSPSPISQNSLHGRLLSLRYMVQNYFAGEASRGPEDFLEIAKILKAYYGVFYLKNMCSVTKATYVDVLTLLGKTLVLGINQFQFSSDNTPDIGTKTTFLRAVQFPAIQLMQDFLAEMSIVNEKEKYGDRQKLAGGLLRTSLIELFITYSALEYISGSSDDIFTGTGVTPLILSVASSDLDACARATRVFSQLRIGSNNKSRELVLDFETQTLATILPRQSDTEVSANIISELADVLQDYVIMRRSQFPEWLTRNIREIDLERYHNLNGSPSSQQALQKLEGFVLDQHIQREGWTADNTLHFESYIARLRESLREEMPYPSRYAAIRGLSGLRHVLGSTQEFKNQNSSILKACILVYDCLNDDEEEIRYLAAEIIKKIITDKNPEHQICSLGFVPLVASELMLKCLIRHYGNSKDLYREALSRVIGIKDLKSANGIKFDMDAAFLEARKEDNALFVEEKQNLFIDPYREVVLWSKVLQDMPPLISHAGADLLCGFVCDGLERFTAVAKSEHDGPLGWTTKPEVFLLAMRVIHGSRIVLKWRTKTNRVYATGSMIRALLMELLEAGESSELHPLLLEKASTTLHRSVSARLRAISSGVHQILAALES